LDRVHVGVTSTQQLKELKLHVMKQVHTMAGTAGFVDVLFWKVRQ